MPTPIDAVLVLALVAWGVWDHFHEVPRLREALASGRPGERARCYRRIIVIQWLLVALTFGAWRFQHRALAPLGLVLPVGMRLWAALGIVVVLTSLLLMQARAARALTPERRERVRARFTGVAAGMLPRTAGELGGFSALSLTAGVCEEILARGYFIWFFGAWFGPIGGLLVSTVLFGLGHAYQGASGVLKTGVVGLVMGCLYLGTRSLVPAVVVHALVDLYSGYIGYEVLRDRVAAAPLVRAPTASSA